MLNGFSIDVEDWFHILESSATPPRESWDTLEQRVEPNIKRLLKMLNETNIRATFFWLGWLAQKHKSLVRECCDEGHEIASHSYYHVLPHKVGPEHFKSDIDRAKKVLEDIIGKQVFGFRVPGFGIRKNTKWAFDGDCSIVTGNTLFHSSHYEVSVLFANGLEPVRLVAYR